MAGRLVDRRHPAGLATHLALDADRAKAEPKTLRVEIQLAIEWAGSQPVSISENIDDTPPGRLVRNIIADLAEFYSANLANEILKGPHRKLGWVFTAQDAYWLSQLPTICRRRDIRTVEADPERAPLIRRAFELYATGDWSIKRLHQLLTEQGLTVQPTPNRPSAPLTLSKFAKVLRNRYYLGIVTYRGNEYPGKHEALVTPELFAQVQRILDDRNETHIKQFRHQHYLRGLLRCRRCSARLLYTVVRGKSGGQFAYYVCLKRHHGEGCDLPYLPAFAAAAPCRAVCSAATRP